jgi:hypothetical protein
MRNESIIGGKCGNHESLIERRKHGITQGISPTWISKSDFKASMMTSAARKHNELCR